MNVNILALLLAIPLAIAANLLTPQIQRWWATTTEARRQKRIARLQAELKKLTTGPATIQSPRPAGGRRKDPIVRPVNCSSFSLNRLLKAVVISFENVEERFPTTAHDLIATLTYTSFTGESLTLKSAPWAFALGQQERAELVTTVSIGMAEIRDLIVLIYEDPTDQLVRQVEQAFMVPGDDTYNGKPHQILQYGEWTLLIHLEGDNFAGDYRYRLSLKPRGGPGIAPIQD